MKVKNIQYEYKKRKKNYVNPFLSPNTGNYEN